MSGDEILVLFGSIALTAWLWGRWTMLCIGFRDFGRAGELRVLGVLAPVLAAVGLYFVLGRWASYDVRDDLGYTVLYFVFGLTWLALVAELAGVCGLSLRDDWIERRNPAAAVLGTALLWGGMAAYAGANIGDGPGWWVVAFSAGLSTGLLFAVWQIYARVSGAMEAIVIGRDLGAAFRLGGLLLAVGLLGGRAAAGNWQSAPATVRDFMTVAWPALPYAIGAGALERGLRAGGPARTGLTLLVHLAAAGLALHAAGPWQ